MAKPCPLLFGQLPALLSYFLNWALEHGKPRRTEGEGEKAGHKQEQKGVIGQQRQIERGAAHLQEAGGKEGYKDA